MRRIMCRTFVAALVKCGHPLRLASTLIVVRSCNVRFCNSIHRERGRPGLWEPARRTVDQAAENLVTDAPGLSPALSLQALRGAEAPRFHGAARSRELFRSL